MMTELDIIKLKSQAALGYVPALFSLGRVYLIGKRIKGKKKEGFAMMRAAAEKGFVPALEIMMGISQKSVYPILARLAQKDDAEGEVIHMLAHCYKDGIAVEKDLKEFIRLLEKAAEKQCTRALFDLGIIYEYGKFNVEKDFSKAFSYYEQGASLEDANCMTILGTLLVDSEECPHDEKHAFELFTKAAEMGNGNANYNLGNCYKNGIGTEKDAAKALECYVKATELGTEAAYWDLYLYYMDGECVPRDFRKATEWLHKGDEAGFMKCTYQLSLHYQNGDGVERDLAKAFYYLNKAGGIGHEDAYFQETDRD